MHAANLRRVFVSAAFVLVFSLFALQWRDLESLRSQLTEEDAALRKDQRNLKNIESDITEKNRLIEEANLTLSELQAEAQNQRIGDSKNSAGSSEGPTGKADEAELKTKGAPFVSHILALGERAVQLGQRIAGFPDFNIPEISLLSPSEWIGIASKYPGPDTPENIRATLASIADRAKQSAIWGIQQVISRLKVEDARQIDEVYSGIRARFPEEVVQRYEVLRMDQLEPGLLNGDFTRRLISDYQFVLVIREKQGSGRASLPIFIGSRDGKNFDGIGTIPAQP
ncbi:MAG: hypothetical protein RLZZ399_1264 [Verrucomicrobiota bacterium]|jgi:hypothetical protein